MSKPKWQRLVELVRSTSPGAILQAAQICDGHTIIHPDAFTNAGLASEVVEHLTLTHRSDFSDPKFTIFVQGKSVKELSGVYGLDMLKFLAAALDVQYPESLGRSRQARAIQQALVRHFSGATPRALTE